MCPLPLSVFQSQATLRTRRSNKPSFSLLVFRYINHSCEPNCESRIVDGGRVAIVALRDIVAGEELFYDYQ